MPKQLEVAVARLVFGAFACALLAGCASWRVTKVPMDMIREPARCAAPVDTLLVFLPGAYSRPEEFVDEGIVRTLRDRRVAADVWIVDAHLGYYEERSIVERLQTDVIVPAQARGYRHIWWVGVSVGGFGAMIHTLTHPGQVEGIVAIAPYLGQREIIVQVRSAGGLRGWKAPVGDLPLERMDEMLWRWLQRYEASPSALPPLYLGYGRDDRFADSHALLSAALPPSHVFSAAGGHDWPPWRSVWSQMVAVLPLAVDPGCAVGGARQ